MASLCKILISPTCPQDDALIDGIGDGSQPFRARLFGATSGAGSKPVEEGVPPVAEASAATAMLPAGPTKEGHLYIGDAKAPVMTCQVPISTTAELRDFVGVYCITP